MAEITWLKELSRLGVRHIGAQAHLLGQLSQDKILVPNLFVVSSKLTQHFFQHKNLYNELDSLMNNLNLFKPDEFSHTSKNIKALILKHEFPNDLAKILVKAYNKLHYDKWIELTLSTTENVLPARLLEVFEEKPVRAKGDANFLESVKQLWADLFNPEVLAYRHRHGLDKHQLDVAVIVSQIPDVVCGGVLTTIDELHGNKNLINIEAIWGMPDELISGQTDSDFYQVERHTWRINQTHLSKQKFIRPSRNPYHRQRLLWGRGNKPKLTEAEIVALAKIGNKISNSLFFPQKVYWLKSGTQFYITRTEKIDRAPETRLGTKLSTPIINNTKLFQGIAVSPGVADGLLKVISNNSQDSRVTDNHILLVENLTDDIYESARKSAGVIASHANYSAHAAVMLRDVGIPVVGDVPNILEKFKAGDRLTINGLTGEVFRGLLNHGGSSETQVSKDLIKVLTKTFVSLPELDSSVDLSSPMIDGVTGVSCHTLINTFNLHPQELIKKQAAKKFETDLSAYIQQISEHTGQREIFYSLLNLSPDERQNLGLSNNIEVDSNPSKDLRGLEWLLENRDWLKFELDLYKKIRSLDKRIKLVIPAFKTRQELIQLEKNISAKLLEDGYWVSITSPAGIFEVSNLELKFLEGVIVSYDQLLSNLYLQDIDTLVKHNLNTKSSTAISEFFTQTATKLKQQKLKFILELDQLDLSTHLVHDLVEKGIFAFSTIQNKLYSLRQEIANAEHWHSNKH